MSNDSAIANLLLLYAGELLTFTAILSLIVRNGLRTLIEFWILENIISLIEISKRFDSLQSTKYSFTPIAIVILTALSDIIRFSSVTYSNKLSPYSYFILALIFYIVLLFLLLKLVGLVLFLPTPPEPLFCY